MGDDGVRAFSFTFERPLDRWARLFAIVPARSFVRADEHGFEAVYGPWRLATTWSNVAAVERTGPYQAWKVAGPPRVSWRDRGITMAPTTEAGACLRFRRPVPGVDPLGVVKHPGLTLGVDELDEFIAFATERIAATAPDAPGVPPTHHEGTMWAALRALRNWRRRSVDHDEHTVAEVEAPGDDRAGDADDQPVELGAGPMFHRRYRMRADNARLGAEEVMARMQADPNVLAAPDFAPFTKSRGRSGEMRVGDRYVIQIAGPWKGAVEVIDVSPHSFRLATLEGHMESGTIEMTTADVDDGVRGVSLTIESWARSHDRALDLLYDKLGFAKALQSEMWAIACDRFVELTGGEARGRLCMLTERASAGPES